MALIHFISSVQLTQNVSVQNVSNLSNQKLLAFTTIKHPSVNLVIAYSIAGSVLGLPETHVVQQ